MSGYRFLVDVDGGGVTRRHQAYDGEDAADAMAAWSKAISAGVEYVTLEALLVKPFVYGQAVEYQDHTGAWRLARYISVYPADESKLRLYDGRIIAVEAAKVRQVQGTVPG